MDHSAKRAAMRVLSYGVYIVSAKSGDSITAAIVTWVSQASIEPPLIMMGIKRDGRIYREVKESRKFVLNIVGEDQKKIAASFMKKCEVDGNKINGYIFIEGKSGAPVFNDVPYYMECEVRQWIDGGDHDIVIADVIEAGATEDAKALDLRSAGWKYGG